MAKKLIPAVIDWRIPPGEMVIDCLESCQLNEVQLAEYLGWELKDVQKLLTSEIAMTEEVAIKVAAFLDMPEYYWVNSVRKYRDFIAKKKENEVDKISYGSLFLSG